jgi:quercetin dioxygenase-like cupin family protein
MGNCGVNFAVLSLLHLSHPTLAMRVDSFVLGSDVVSLSSMRGQVAPVRIFPYPPRERRGGADVLEGLILHHGEAHGVTLHQTRVDYLVTAEHSKQCSLFEFTVAPGFNTGAHYHTKIEEIFYVLEGELDLRCGERTVRGGPGTCVFVPPGAAHAFGNSGSKPGRMLLITANRAGAHHCEPINSSSSPASYFQFIGLSR